MPMVHKGIGNSPLERWELVIRSITQAINIWSLPGAQLKSINVMTSSSRSVIGSKDSKGGWGSMRQRAIGASVAAWQRTTEVSGCEGVRRAGKFHAGFMKSSAQVLGWKQVSWALRESVKVRARLLDAVVHPLHELSLVRLREEQSTREVSKSIFELKKYSEVGTD